MASIGSADFTLAVNSAGPTRDLAQAESQAKALATRISQALDGADKATGRLTKSQQDSGPRVRPGRSVWRCWVSRLAPPRARTRLG